VEFVLGGDQLVAGRTGLAESEVGSELQEDTSEGSEAVVLAEPEVLVACQVVVAIAEAFDCCTSLPV
jgi:hypothetical protein